MLHLACDDIIWPSDIQQHIYSWFNTIMHWYMVAGRTTRRLSEVKMPVTVLHSRYMKIMNKWQLSQRTTLLLACYGIIWSSDIQRHIYRWFNTIMHWHMVAGVPTRRWSEVKMSVTLLHSRYVKIMNKWQLSQCFILLVMILYDLQTSNNIYTVDLTL